MAADMKPLYIFMDLEAAHGDVYFGDIVELSAQVDPRVMEEEIFDQLINTRQSLTHFVLEVCKITRKMLNGRRYFPHVFNEFLRWVDGVVETCTSREEGTTFYPVLVAHGGFDMDFMMIQGNLERNEMDLDTLTKHNICFADTYHFLKRMRLAGKTNCLSGSKLSIEALLKKLFPRDRIVGQHRALADVKFMIKIFLKSEVKSIFDEISQSIATFESRYSAYKSKHTSKKETELLDTHLPKDLAKVTHTMTLKRLLRNGITYVELQNLFQRSVSFLDFFDRLKDLGIDRKAGKSIASRLSNMGLVCNGKICEDTRAEVGEEGENDTLNFLSDIDLSKKDKESNDNNNITNGSEKSQISRSDSGYESNVTVDEEELTRFYNMFVDEFFYPPEVYEYLFGNFTTSDLEEMDDFIADLFDARYPEYFENQGPPALTFLQEETNEEKPPSSPPLEEFFSHISFMEEKKKEQIKSRNDERYKDVVPEVEETWDDEITECEEFLLPTDRGRLGKVVPIGMTMDDLNGKCLSGKVPLFKHFQKADLGHRPKGGIPKMFGKKGAQERKRLKYENKKHTKNIEDMNMDDGAHTVVRASKTGEVFVLI